MDSLMKLFPPNSLIVSNGETLIYCPTKKKQVKRFALFLLLFYKEILDQDDPSDRGIHFESPPAARL
jgi:hypothetical protein